MGSAPPLSISGRCRIVWPTSAAILPGNMKSLASIRLADVQTVYAGPEGRLWELLMGEQIHLGGLGSSLDLASRAGIQPGERGIDLCCASGAGMRFLVRFRQAGRMTGVDATARMVELGRQRTMEEGLVDRVTFVEGNACASGLPAAQADFVWGEDAWCYVEDKPRLIAEAIRLVKPGGRIAFTDWMEGREPLTEAEAGRYLRFMKFPNVLTLAEYASLLEAGGCRTLDAADTGRFATHLPLYLDMLERQLTYDALKLLGFDQALAETLLGELRFILTLAQSGRVIQGRIVAEKPA